VLVEVISRATSKLDLLVIASPKSKNESACCFSKWISKDKSISCWSKILANWSDYDLVEEIKVQIEPQKMPTKFTLSFGSHSETVMVTKQDKNTFAEIQKSIQMDRQDDFDNGKPYA